MRNPVFPIVLLLAGLAGDGAGQKPEACLEVRSPHFVVVSDAGERQARRVAQEFEQIRSAFLKAFPNVRVDPGEPIIILAVKDEA